MNEPDLKKFIGEKYFPKIIPSIPAPFKYFSEDTQCHPAGPDHYGFTNDHVALLSGASDYEGKIAYAISRKAFEIGRGPQLPRIKRLPGLEIEDYNPLEYIESFEKHSLTKEFSKAPVRGWKHIETLCQEMPFEEALRLAEEIAKREGVVLYDDRVFGCRSLKDSGRFLWKPEFWRPIVG